jgi:hypothetical protein
MRGLKADMGHEEPDPTVLQEDNQTLVLISGVEGTRPSCFIY